MNPNDVPRQLSLWDLMPRIWSSKSVRPAPNPVLRGSLFGLIQRGKDEILKEYVVYKDKDMSVTYDGVALGQADLDCPVPIPCTNQIESISAVVVWLFFAHCSAKRDGGSPPRALWGRRWLY
jgi:hypothetical protein